MKSSFCFKGFIIFFPLQKATQLDCNDRFRQEVVQRDFCPCTWFKKKISNNWICLITSLLPWSSHLCSAVMIPNPSAVHWWLFLSYSKRISVWGWSCQCEKYKLYQSIVDIRNRLVPSAKLLTRKPNFPLKFLTFRLIRESRDPFTDPWGSLLNTSLVSYLTPSILTVRVVPLSYTKSSLERSSNSILFHFLF